MPLPFDATLKSMVAGNPGDFSSLFGLPTDLPATSVNVDLSTMSAATDIALAYGDPFQEVVDLNFQTGPDANLPSRLHLYNAALHGRHAVPVRSVAVLLRQKADSANLTGLLAYGEGTGRVEFHYEVVRLWQQPVENALRWGLSALPLATLCQMPAGQSLPDALRTVVQQIQRRLGQEASHAESMRLMTAAYILTGLRVKKDAVSSIYRGVGLMTEMTAYDEALEEAAIACHRLLVRQGRKRFGDPDAKTETELKSIRDLDRLERLADAILSAKSWSELLATP